MLYTLIVFDRGVGYPEEFPILKSVFKGDAICAAQCGPINVCQFDSDKPLTDISELLKAHQLEFILTQNDTAMSCLPKKIQDHFDGIRQSGTQHLFDQDFPQSQSHADNMFESYKKDLDKRAKNIVKLSLEDQLKAAIAKEDYEAAAMIQKAIDKSKKEA